MQRSKNQIWRHGSSGRCNHLFLILSKSVKGFPGCEKLKMGLSNCHWLQQSPLQQVGIAVLPVISAQQQCKPSVLFLTASQLSVPHQTLPRCRATECQTGKLVPVLQSVNTHSSASGEGNCALNDSISNTSYSLNMAAKTTLKYPKCLSLNRYVHATPMPTRSVHSIL